MILGISLAIWVGLFVLAFLARREQGDLLQRMSSYAYKLCRMYRLPFAEREQVGKDLERLHPGLSSRELLVDYYVEKLRLVLLVLAAGSLLSGLFFLKQRMDADLGTDGVLERGTVGEEEQEVQLIAKVAEETEELWVNVAAKQLEPQELERLFAECGDLLEEEVLRQRGGSEQVTGSLVLPEVVEGYPFEITWKSSDPTVLEADGSWKAEGRAVNQEVCLTAMLSYGEETYKKEILVSCVSALQEDTLGRRLQEAVWQREEESRYEEVMYLPQELEGESIHWRLVTEDNSPLFLLLTLVAAVGVFFLKDKDLHEQTLLRKRSMKIAYPVILNKFVLYMEAGMTVRGSFMKIAGDYASNKQVYQEAVAYEEMLYSCNELSAGMSEGAVYEHFGRRSGMQEYARFAAMLGQNLKKGNGALLVRLREESDKAMQENLQFRKKLGEEAETKLLVPMIMMMGMVMLLVMIPAFTAF